VYIGVTDDVSSSLIAVSDSVFRSRIERPLKELPHSTLGSMANHFIQKRIPSHAQANMLRAEKQYFLRFWLPG
jgi:hypothetical protein